MRPKTSYEYSEGCIPRAPHRRMHNPGLERIQRGKLMMEWGMQFWKLALSIWVQTFQKVARHVANLLQWATYPCLAPTNSCYCTGKVPGVAHLAPSIDAYSMQNCPLTLTSKKSEVTTVIGNCSQNKKV